MLEVAVYNIEGEQVDTVQVDEALLGVRRGLGGNGLRGRRLFTRHTALEHRHFRHRQDQPALDDGSGTNAVPESRGR